MFNLPMRLLPKVASSLLYLSKVLADCLQFKDKHRLPERGQGCVLVGVQLYSHRRKIHRLLDHLIVAWKKTLWSLYLHFTDLMTTYKIQTDVHSCWVISYVTSLLTVSLLLGNVVFNVAFNGIESLDFYYVCRLRNWIWIIDARSFLSLLRGYPPCGSMI